MADSSASTPSPPLPTNPSTTTTQYAAESSTWPQPYATVVVAEHTAPYNNNNNNGPPQQQQQQQQQQPFHRSLSGGTDSNHSGGNYYVGIPQSQQPNFHSSYQRSNSGGVGNGGGTTTSYGPPTYGNTSYGHNCSAVNTTDPDQVDSALIAALREPRERIALLQLEAVLVHFLHQDSAGWLEVAGPYNSVIFSPTTQTQPTHTTDKRQTSFQRCVLHRLADRFGIVREPGALLGPGSLRLIKLPQSQLPPLLIADMADRIPVFVPSPLVVEPLDTDATTHEEMATAATNNSNNNNSSKTPIRKVKLMKRSTSAGGMNGSASNGNGNHPTGLRKKTLASGEDKERAYAEARARIFQEEQQLEQTVATDSNTTNSTNTNNNGATANPSLTSSMTQLSDATASLSLFPSSSSSDPMPQQQQQHYIAAKAVYRNRAQEEADPDFRRQPGAAPMLFYPHVPLQVNAPVWTPRQSHNNNNNSYNDDNSSGMVPPPPTLINTNTMVTSTDESFQAPPQQQQF